MPDDLRIERVSPADVPPGWVEDTQATRAFGDAWLANAATPLLAVPSAIIPDTWNVLLNPTQSDAARIVIAHVVDHVLDPRLLG